MSGIYQIKTNSGTVTSPGAGRTLISVNESGQLFTKSESGRVNIVDKSLFTIPAHDSLTANDIGKWVMNYKDPAFDEFLNSVNVRTTTSLSDYSGSFGGAKVVELTGASSASNGLWRLDLSETYNGITWDDLTQISADSSTVISASVSLNEFSSSVISTSLDESSSSTWDVIKENRIFELARRDQLFFATRNSETIFRVKNLSFQPTDPYLSTIVESLNFEEIPNEGATVSFPSDELSAAIMIEYYANNGFPTSDYEGIGFINETRTIWDSATRSGTELFLTLNYDNPIFSQQSDLQLAISSTTSPNIEVLYFIPQFQAVVSTPQEPIVSPSLEVSDSLQFEILGILEDVSDGLATISEPPNIYEFVVNEGLQTRSGTSSFIYTKSSFLTAGSNELSANELGAIEYSEIDNVVTAGSNELSAMEDSEIDNVVSNAVPSFYINYWVVNPNGENLVNLFTLASQNSSRSSSDNYLNRSPIYTPLFPGEVGTSIKFKKVNSIEVGGDVTKSSIEYTNAGRLAI